MDKTLTLTQIHDLAITNQYEFASLNSVIRVESSGHGFSPVTGRIIIQFEPSWFKREYHEWQSHTAGHTWVNNGVGNQTEEWKAFDDAFYIDKNAAMQATSIGLMQVMGFHWSELGFTSVGAMWDFAKESEANQVTLGIRFIKSIPKLNQALINKDWKTFAYYYNGSAYAKFKYDTRLATEYDSSKRLAA